jgi:hypothetical protein
VAAGAPVGKLLFVKGLGHMRMPFAGYRLDHRARVELTAIDRIVQRKRRPTSKVASTRCCGRGAAEPARNT